MLVVVGIALAATGQYACMGACDIITPAKRLSGPYSLVLVESELYYVEQDLAVNQPAGVLGGSIDDIGWSQKHIVARREGMFGGVGWMILSVQDGSVEGPLSDAEWAARRAGDRDLAAITVEPVSEAWKRL
jgi:hypothetical protein